MANTARLALPLIAPEQAQKHITHNEALTLMDGLVQMAVEAIGTVTPPMSPVLGDCYILGASATGDWAGHDGDLALWTVGGWRFLTPSEGWLAWDKAVGAAFVLTSGGWTALGATVTSFQNLDLLGVKQLLTRPIS